ncbi:MAG: alginate O-acetyltransferase AlgX-related protein [Longimicrobiales bacterium]
MRLSTLVISILALAAVADGVARFVPDLPLGFRAHETMARFAYAHGPYEPLRSATVDRSYGDLASLGNLSGVREYHEDRTTSDQSGYRNAAAAPDVDTHYDAVLAGDSFALGVGSSDSDTLAIQLGSHGLRVYNAASHLNLSSLDAIVTAARHAHARLVLWEIAERKTPPLTVPADPPPYPALHSRSPELAIWLWGLRSVSPLRIAASRAWRTLEDDRWLPNPYRDAVVRAELVSGGPMLFLPGEVACFHDERAVDIRPWERVADDLRSRGLDLAVVLVPVKYTVYYPLRRDRRPSRWDPNPYHERLAASLRSAGIRTIDLGPSLRRAARAALDRGETIYWRDDTHWNARGVAVAAAEIGREL